MSSPHRKIIFATNVAESSITVEGVTAVIDTGLVRTATYSPWTGLPALHIGRISKASAEQRAGRAGRTAPGQVLRLYSVEDYQARPAFDTPEILRSDLSQLLLSLRVLRMPDAAAIHWLDAPPLAATQSADALLDRLGATGNMAQRLARFPLSPRLARVLLEAIDHGIGEAGCALTALLGSGARVGGSDILAAMELPQDARTQQQTEQLWRLVKVRDLQAASSPPQENASLQRDDALLLAVLTGFPDRVAKRRSGNQVLLSSGSSAEFSGNAPTYPFMVALDAEDRSDKALPQIRMASRIEPEWLIELFPERVTEKSILEWNDKAERVDSVEILMYDALVIQESRGAPADPAAASELLAGKAIEAGLGRFLDEALLAECIARIRIAGLVLPDLTQTLAELCTGLRSFSQLKEAASSFLPLLKEKAGARRMDEVAPERIRLGNGRFLKVHYEQHKPPWIASRLQDFFGMKETPRVGPDRTPVVVHLLAPNQRPLQMTTDLAGFWERLYPQIRREYMRRYPRHTWPERPQD